MHYKRMAVPAENIKDNIVHPDLIFPRKMKLL